MALTYGTATAFGSASALNSLATATPTSIGTIDNTTALADDYLVEVTIANIAESGNKQAIIYARSSVDGTNYSEASSRKNLKRIGLVDLTVGGTTISAACSVAAAFGGSMPPKVDIYVENDAGVAFAGSGNSAQYRAVTYG